MPITSGKRHTHENENTTPSRHGWMRLGDTVEYKGKDAIYYKDSDFDSVHRVWIAYSTGGIECVNVDQLRVK